ncbi:hypothetical protein PYW08_016429 [Mythimna loreyi]|uniref:Uncharacterized protein n=1 Tax=Mythimna loreyi TaxID=667449 RepID=A0ACC2R268_9NEOP|nr:hypothetical protein PYW08_016429 [Mythimna loreyi]
MEISGVGKSPNTSLSFRYNANNEELEELFHVCEDDPPTPQCDPPPGTPVENASPKRGERSSSIIDKYFKSMRSEKALEKLDDAKPAESKPEEVKAAAPKEVTSSPMKEYLNRLGKRSTPDVTPDVREGSNETWKLFHDFKFKIAQAVEDMKTRSVEDTKEKSIPRENSASDSEENSAIRDLDKESVGDTDNQVSSLDSSLQNLSDMTQPLTAKATERDPSVPADNKNYSDSSDDTHKNLAFYNEAAVVRKDVLNDAQMEVESGVEALEDTIDSFGDINVDPLLSSGKPQNLSANPVPPPPPTVTFGPPPSKNNNKGDKVPKKTNHFCSFSMYFLTFLILLSFTLFPNSNIWNGFVFGLWFFCFTSSLKCWVLDTYFSEFEPKSNALIQLKRSSAMPPSYTIPSVKEHTPIKKYEGWINHYRFPDYDPHTYHINKTTTAFMKLEGCNLRISYTVTKIPKRALWDEKLEKVAFYQHRLYNLTGAKVLLMPVGLVKRRQWSKKYPICVVLSDNEKIQVLEKETFTAEKRVPEYPLEKKKEQHEMETETSSNINSNTSPEKRRKFVWRRREKSTSHSDGETGKEGLRHRLVRKMHRDKKTDTVSTGTEPAETQSQSAVPSEKPVLDDSSNDRESDLASKSATSTKDDDDDFDDTEMSKIKDLLEETEREIAADGTSEGEWSLHVKYSKDRHSYLFLFARTGRDKHEWYRRLVIAITDAKAATPENSAAEEKSGSEPTTTENKDNIEMAVYKFTDKEGVAFNKTSNKAMDSLNDGGGVTITSISQPIPPRETDYEKIFWPYLLKIIESHDLSGDSTSEKAVMCQIEPTPRDKSKNKKKRKEKENKNAPPECTCRLLPSEVTWVNTMMARVMFDLMRDPIMINRLQNRIQRKLNTLKLPAFMSPLVVTELSLVGACPLVERVAAPTWDARGVWLDADIRYDGGAYIAILTQINLMKLKEKNLTLEEQLMPSNHRLDIDVQTTSASPDTTQQSLRMRKPAIYDSEVEDSAESSDDDESPPVQPVDSTETVSSDTPSTTAVVPEPTTSTSTSSKKKFLRMVDKIATNKYFQQVTDYKYVKRAMEGLSNTDIKLHLEVQALEGRLTFNLPPPPHDRVWLGFRTNPQLVLKARPAVGARTLRFAHITNWIEQKLSKEFEKILVLPNMEDFIIDIMTATPVQYP